MHTTGAPYSSEENAIGVRANKEALRHIQAFVYEITNDLNNWSDFVPMVQRIMNTSHHQMLGCAPYDILYGTLRE
jgi:hypothetical protein